jgi:L-threonylcarbamoyladenylate synthase
MITTYWRVDPAADSSHSFIQEAARMLREGKLVAFPTETVYGLGADARSTAAVERIFAAKGRPSDNPLIVHIADRAQLAGLAEPLSRVAERLIERFWPGPLTIVLPALPGAISPQVTAGLATVAVRMPGHPVALRLIAAAECPVAAPSANRSGRPSPTRAEHVEQDLGGRIEGLLDGGPAGVGLESTVIELLGDRVHILRPGGISVSQLRQVAPEVTVDESLGGDSAADAADPHAAPRSPGMKYKHYAPQGQMTVVSGNPPHKAIDWMQHQLDAAAARGERTGVLTFEEHARLYRADLVVSCGSLARLETAAQRLYAALRQFDEERITYIMAEACPVEGIGFAIMNRLIKAAGGHVVHM